MSPSQIIALVIGVGCIGVALLIHEFAHAWMAYQLGDPTAKYEGRLTLNPVVHFEPIGALCLVITFWTSNGGMIMGWAKPVPIDSDNFKSPRLDMALVAAAGPFVNFCLAFLCSMLWITGIAQQAPFLLQALVKYLIVANVGFGLFNLFPFPPLDGWKIVGAMLPAEIHRKMQAWEHRLGIYSFVALFAIIIFLGPYTLQPVFHAVLSIFLGTI